MIGRVRLLAAASALFCGGATLVVCLVPFVHFAYRSEPWHVALATASALVSVLGAFLVFGRSDGAARDDRLLVLALGLLSVSGVLVLAATGTGSRSTISWEARVCSALGAAILAWAAVTPSWRLKHLRRSGVAALVALLALVTVLPLLITGLGGRLPAGVSVTAAPVDATWPDLDAPVQIIALYALDTFLFAVAAVGFLRRAERLGDGFSAWLALGAVYAAASRFNYILYPTRYTDWVYSGDLFWLVFCTLLLVATLSEITSYWRMRTRAAVLEERRRIAGEFHDGLAQELAYASRNLGALAPSSGEDAELVARISSAIERAQVESRQALAALSTPIAAPLELVLERAVTDVADRFGVKLELELATGIEVSAARAETLVRVGCEAVANAAKHSGHDRIVVLLERDGARVVLSVRDSGCGFDPSAPVSGYGLISMRDRARSLGGRLHIDSAGGRGTVVELAL